MMVLVFVLKIFIVSIYVKIILKNNTLKNFEEYHQDNFNRDEKALSEDGRYKGIFAKEYEVQLNFIIKSYL